jgi:tRNA modification GTPase
VTIQYPEYDVPDVTNEELLQQLEEIGIRIQTLLASYKKGEILREGMKMVIAGRPNVGKSLLLNRLIRKDKAIVTDIPGTTRDVIDEYINIGGIPFA